MEQQGKLGKPDPVCVMVATPEPTGFPSMFCGVSDEILA